MWCVQRREGDYKFLVAKGEYWVWTLMGSLKVADSISGREYKLRPLEREKVMFGSLPEEER